MHELIILIAKYFIGFPVLGVACVLWRAKGGTRTQLLATLLLSALATIILVKIATSIYHDARPFVRDGVVPYFSSSTDNGFPSDHAALSALLALVVFGVSRKLGSTLLVVAVLIGVTRVIAGVHHAQDVIGGFCLAAIGYGLARLCIWLFVRYRSSRAA